MYSLSSEKNFLLYDLDGVACFNILLSAITTAVYRDSYRTGRALQIFIKNEINYDYERSSARL